MRSNHEMNIGNYPMNNLLLIVSNLLESMLHTNNKIPSTHITYFHSRAIPNITVHSYLTRIHRFAPFTNEVLLSILIYFDRLSKLDQSFTINSYNIHRLLITSVVVASKFTSDIFYANTRYAKVGGLPLLELNQLELEFLFLIDFQLHVQLEDLQAYANQLLTHALSTPISLHSPTKLKHQSPLPPPPSPPLSSSHVVLPLTPPYTKNNKVITRKSFHPYLNTLRKTKRNPLGFISPGD
ncbi:PHO85 cyclin-7 [Choanephora cucurbitarum]|uniref:PHO85 cyclin-7 n=1 Tax=Choanephora cucurbitarum TaxID=101091 RepID=A0A1C7N1B6_9FUNG|nr:PHO85 cyclin-7 [Choanephora cucurbitarum]